MPGKKFWQRRPDPAAESGYSWRLDSIRRVPYRLPQLLAAVERGETIYIAEGEKDVLALEAAGAVATCNPGGAGKWKPEYSDHFRGARVVIIADRDEPGRQHAADVARKLAGIAREVSVVEAASGKDSADHLDAGLGLADFRPVAGPAGPAGTTSAEPATAVRRLKLTPASSIPPRPVIWGWDERIPAGAISLIAGREGIGKSLFLIDMTAKVTRGTLPGAFHGRPRGVIYCATEDSWNHTIIPRLIAAGADMTRVYRAEVEIIESGGVLDLIVPRDCDLIADAIKASDIALLALDPLMSAIDARVDTHKDRDLRTALEPLVRMADNSGCMVVGLAHFSKAGTSDALTLITGSRAFTAIVRAVIAIARDNDSEEGTSVVTQVKNSLGRMNLPSLSYVIKSACIETPEGNTYVGRLTFTGETQLTVEDILQAQAGPGSNETKEMLDDAAAWLRGYLTDQGGEAAAKDVHDAARSARIIRSHLYRSLKRLGIVTARTGTFPSVTIWYLPENAPGDLADPVESAGPVVP